VVPEEQALQLISESWAKAKGVMPLAYDGDASQLVVAVSDPGNLELREEIRKKADVCNLVVVAAPSISLQRLWAVGYGKKGRGKRPHSEDEPGRIAEKPSIIPEQPSVLGLEFSFAAEAPQERERKTGRHGPRVLLWLSQVYVSKLFISLLDLEGCQVESWDGVRDLAGDWDYLVYDDDSVASAPDALAGLKRRFPTIQLVPRPSWTSCLLRSPLSYQRMRDGYSHMVEYTHRRAGKKKLDSRFSRYSLAIARVAPMTPFQVDTLVVACEMAQLFLPTKGKKPDWDALAAELRPPYPVFDIYRAASVPFDRCGAKPGASTTDSPFAARIYYLVSSFLHRIGNRQLTTLEALSHVTDWLRERSQREFDPVAVDALLRVMREEVLDGCLPPGPAEVILVADHPVDWRLLAQHLQNDGWRLVTADGVAEARKLVERRCPDAVVWAATGAIEWIHWQSESHPDLNSYLILEEANSALARTALETGFADVWAGDWDPGVAAAKLRHGMKRPAPALAPNTVQGSLDQLSIVDLVSTLGNGGRSVAIELTNGDRRANIVLWQGRLRSAVSTDVQGEDAVYDVISWAQGTFVLRAIDEEPLANCHQPIAAILLEGCRRLDEHVSTEA
jgi:hypothetical protein